MKKRFEFSSLEDAARVCGQMADEIEAQHAMLFGMQAMVCALMATHADQTQMQLGTTTYLEHLLGKAPPTVLSDEQKTKARNFVEGMQVAIQPLPPLGGATASLRPRGS